MPFKPHPESLNPLRRVFYVYRGRDWPDPRLRCLCGKVCGVLGASVSMRYVWAHGRHGSIWHSAGRWRLNAALLWRERRLKIPLWLGVTGLTDVLRQLAKRCVDVTAVGGTSDDAGPDRIGVIGSCAWRYEQLGKDTARCAEQVKIRKAIWNRSR